MSLYNMLFGENPMSEQLKEILDLDGENKKWPTGRFRDIFLSEDGTKIILYTRNGGGNRECWEEDTEDGERCDCPGCVISCILPNHPNYIKDYDDDFDSTYAYIEFSVPEMWLPVTTLLAGISNKPETVHEKFEKEIEQIKKSSKDELLKNPKYGPILKIIEDFISSNSSNPKLRGD